MPNKKYKLIFSPQLAQYLLQCGYRIVELKPKRQAPNETVFVFENSKGMSEQIGVWLEDKGN